jgi:hypothetical protein
MTALAAFAIAANAQASIIQLAAPMSPLQEHPTDTGNLTAIAPGGVLREFTQGTGGTGPRPVSSGEATFVLDTGVPVLHMTVTVRDIDVTGTQTPYENDNLVAAHIHAGSTAIPGVSNAPVRFGFFGMPFNDTDLDVVFTPFASGVGGIFTGSWDADEGQNTTLAAQIPTILDELSYINFHTVQFPGGELRGQLLVLSVPEPGTLSLLFGAGLLAMVAVRRARL